MSTHKGSGDSAFRNQEQASGLKPGMVYSGSVVSVDPITRAFDVKVTGAKNTVLRNCVWAAGVFSGLLGMRTTYLPTPGTNVLVIPGATSFVVGCTPSEFPDLIAGGSKTITGSGKHRVDTKTAANLAALHKAKIPLNSTMGNDMLEGEMEIGNSLGVAITLLNNLVGLSAGGKAKIECALTNDLVRIVSETFRHHSAFGDMEVYNDGRLNMRVDGTNYPHEAWGVLNEKDARVTNSGYVVDLSSIDAAVETGRWRYSEFIGHLGDMVHQFVSEPTATLGKYAEDASRVGKSRFQMMADGTMLMQSVTEIAIERVSRIVVPIEHRKWDDSEGNKTAAMESLTKDYLKIWEYGKDPKDLARTCYQLREYARWLSGMHSYARFLQMDKEWKVPSEADGNSPEWTNRELDKESVNSNQKRHIDTYSCFRIMRDGSQVLLDGYGNSYVSTYGSLQISAARHLEFYAPGDISLIAGQNIYIKARRNIEIAAVVGGLKLKARAWFHALSEVGSMWFKSDADSTAGDGGATLDADTPTPIILDRAMVLETTKGKTIIRSEKELLFETIQGGGESDIVFQTGKGASMRFISGMNILFKGLGSLAFDVRRDIAMSALSVIADLRAKTFNILGICKITPGGLHTKMIKANYILGAKSISGPEMKRGEDQHQNHIGTISDEEEGPVLDGEMPEDIANDPVVALTGGEIWDFFDPDEYIVGDRELYETLSEQRVRTDNDLSSLYASWTLKESALRNAKRTGTKAPFPGKSSVRWQHSGGFDLHKPATQNYADEVTAPTEFTQTATVNKYLKRES